MTIYFSVQGSPQYASTVCASSAHSSPEGSQREDGAGNMARRTQNTKVVGMCIVIGGMDAEGEIFDDSLVMLLD